MVVAALMGKKVKGKKPLLPMARTGPVRLAHSMAGRLRFRVPDLADRSVDLPVLEERLAGVEGIEAVSADARSGSILVTFDEATIQPALIFAAIVRLLGADEELDRPPQPVIQRELRHLWGALNRSVHDRTGGIVDLKSALMILFVTLGLRKMLREPRTILPAGLTLVWWSASGLLQGPRD